MITVNDTGAVTALLVTVSGAAAWGAYLSVHSAEHGLAWAGPHLDRAFRGFGAVTLLGFGLVLLVAPVWLGLGVAYVGLVVVWLVRTVRASLRRAADLGVDEPLAPERHRAVLDRTGRGLLGAAVLVAALAALDLGIRGWVALVDFVLALALAIPGWRAWRKAQRRA